MPETTTITTEQARLMTQALLDTPGDRPVCAEDIVGAMLAAAGVEVTP